MSSSLATISYIGATILFILSLAALSAVAAGRQAMQQDAVLAVREDW